MRSTDFMATHPKRVDTFDLKSQWDIRENIGINNLMRYIPWGRWMLMTIHLIFEIFQSGTMLWTHWPPSQWSWFCLINPFNPSIVLMSVCQRNTIPNKSQDKPPLTNTTASKLVWLCPHLTLNRSQTEVWEHLWDLQCFYIFNVQRYDFCCCAYTVCHIQKECSIIVNFQLLESDT